MTGSVKPTLVDDLEGLLTITSIVVSHINLESLIIYNPIILSPCPDFQEVFAGHLLYTRLALHLHG
jgi:hypothetical protein